MGVAVGIDLGTTNTVVAVMRDGEPVTLQDEVGRKLIPSFVAFHPSGKVLVGESAKDRRVVDPSNTIYSVKRLIGRTFSSDEVQRAIKSMPFEIVEGDKQGVRVVARGEVYTLPEISAFVLRRAKAVAEAAIGEVVDKAVITVPANFNDPQRAATKLAGKLAGLEVLRILNEPTAAALAYGQTATKGERIAVYDLGGGTFDVTVLDLSGDVFEVLATGGDTSLGGDDVDQAIAAEMTNFFLQKFRFDPRPDPTARALLRARAEKLKHLLSDREEASVDMNDVVRGEGGAFLPASFVMDRKKLEQIAAPLVDRTMDTCTFSIETIGLDVADIERVLLVGGATRMPLVARRVEEYFQRPVAGKVNPDEVVAQGAAVQAAALSKTQAKSLEKPVRAIRAAAVGTIVGAAVAPPVPMQASAPVRLPRGDDPESQRSTPVAQIPQAPGRGAIGRVPLVKQAVAFPPGASFSGGTLPGLANAGLTKPSEDRPTAEIDTALLQFMRDESEQAAGAAVPPPVESEPAPSFDFDLIAPTPDKKKAAPPLPPAAMRARADHGGRPLHDAPPPIDIPLAAPLQPLGPDSARAPILPEFDDALPAPDSFESPLRPLPPAAPPRAAPLLIDVTPISLGVEVAGGFCDFLIRANTPVPCDRTRVFRTASDNQTGVRVRVVQGESERFSENTYLGDLELTGLRAAPRGEVEVGVTFEIDADGILNVRAKEELTGRETVARMNLLGAQTDSDEVAAMMARQRKHEVI
jgi:molecular chaperone DnaK